MMMQNAKYTSIGSRMMQNADAFQYYLKLLLVVDHRDNSCNLSLLAFSIIHRANLVISDVIPPDRHHNTFYWQKQRKLKGQNEDPFMFRSAADDNEEYYWHTPEKMCKHWVLDFRTFSLKKWGYFNKWIGCILNFIL